MSVKERTRMIRMMEKIERNKTLSKRIGIRSVPTFGKVREERNEVHRC